MRSGCSRSGNTEAGEASSLGNVKGASSAPGLSPVDCAEQVSCSLRTRARPVSFSDRRFT
jgi:hypothetical protein